MTKKALFSFILFVLLSTKSLGNSSVEYQRPLTIVKIYSSWENCLVTGETLEQNNILYSLTKVEELKDTSQFSATYCLPLTVTKTYLSWEDCVLNGEILEENNVIYSLTRTQRLNNTSQFLASYEIKN